MRYIHLLPTLCLATLLVFTSCNDDKDEVGTETETETETDNSEKSLTVPDLPDGMLATYCVTENYHFACEDEVENPEDITIAEDVSEDSLIVVNLDAPEDIGVTEFTTFDGRRILAAPASGGSAAAIDALAWGLLMYSQDLKAAEQATGPLALGLGAIIAVGAIKESVTDLDEAKAFLKKYYNLDGSNQQNDAILQAMNVNLERLGYQELELDDAVPADIKAMAESLVNLTINAQSICTRYPEYCEPSNPDEALPLLDFSDIQPLPSVSGAAECVRYEYGNCVEWAGIVNDSVFSDILMISDNQAADIAYEIRKESGEMKSREEAYSALVCREDEQKQVYMYGQDDNYVNTNSELTNPQGSAANFVTTLNNYNIPVAQYDHGIDQRAPAVFIETLSGIAPNITNAHIVFGLIEEGYTLGATPSYSSLMNIGDFQSQTGELYNTTIQDIINNWATFGTGIYSADLATLTLQSMTGSILSRLQNGQQVDVQAGYLVDMDFISVVTCETTPVDEKPSVKEVLETIKGDFSCKNEETYMEIIGGDFDDFSGGVDPATAATYLSNFALLEYDTAPEKSASFADTLAIAFPNHSVTHAQFALNTRPSTLNIANNYLGFGDISSGNSTSGFLAQSHPFAASPYSYETPVLNGGTLKVINETQVFYDTTSSSVSGNLLTMLNASVAFDIVMGDQVEVDGTLLQLCLTDKCVDTDGDGFCDDDEIEAGSDPKDPNSVPLDIDGDGTPNDIDCDPNDPTLTDNCDSVLPLSCNTQYNINLNDANTWVDSTGNAPTIHNEFQTYPPNPAWANIIWDGDMDNDGLNNGVNDNWFNFGYASNTTHTLTHEFCACGDVNINIDDMKSDNTGYIDVINQDSQFMQRIVSRTAHSQSTMASWGPVESGAWNAAANGNGVNYELEFGVKNYSGPSGGAVQGTLEYVGHPGLCTAEDVIDSGEPVDTGVDIVYPVVVVVDDIAVSVDSFDFEYGAAEGGEAILNVAGPAVTYDDIGKPVVIVNPDPIIFDVNLGNSEPTDEPMPTNVSGVFGCDNGHLRVVWLDGEGFHSYTSSIGCSGSWSVNF